ncbi:MAG: T9SS type A sorting domain-containing protein [Bacteroidota bacterium]|nr:T9SS type A sorting domain-containing protein [Bacteroidota bacterium]
MSIISAQPDWTVTPSEYEYSMTVSGIAVIHCMESTDENDIVAAFINGEVRGIQALNTDIQGRKYAFMIIYDNDFKSNEVVFKMFDASTDSIFDAQQSIQFSENANIGNSDDPFIFNTDYNLTSTFLTQDSIDENALAGSVVAEIRTTNEVQDTFSLLYNFVDDSFGPDNDYFTISDSILILNEDVNADVKSSYQIHLSGSTIDGCNRDDIYILPVTGQVITATNEPGNSKRKNDVLIYPNPANTSIHFATDKEIETVFIYSAEGILLHKYHNLFIPNNIDISFLRPGLYMVEYYVNGMKSIQKLIVQE